ncbi:MFS transporter small subunit [Demequina lignilytica]
MTNPLAYVLWVLVGAGLIYGISQTAVKAFALFTG